MLISCCCSCFLSFVVAAGTVFAFVPSLPMRILNVMSLVSLCFDKKGPQFVHVVKTPSVLRIDFSSSLLFGNLTATSLYSTAVSMCQSQLLQ